ncbi:MAG TPA: serine hydrolase [Candidatus Acidoferrales bacterium]|nr:serine hydrolase [Candidatus Acidoferrales bacterium]
MKRAFFVAASAAVLFFPRTTSAQPSLDRRVREIAHAMPGTIGVYARTLDDGPPLVEYRSRNLFPTASTIKALVMATAYALEEQTPGTLDTQLTFSHSADLIGGSDFMSEQADGATFTVRQLIVPMIQLSDNTAANMLIGHFGVDQINDVGGQAGLQNTHLARKFIDTAAIVRVQNNVTTPADMASLLYQIEKGAHEDIPTIASAAMCREMIKVMMGQTDREKIPAALPGVPIANKTGEITGTRNDIAVINPYGNTPIILTILTKNLTDYEAANSAIHQIARAVYGSTVALSS